MSTAATHTTSDREMLVWNLFVTALEGGINYWASADEYRWWKEEAAASPGTRHRAADVTGFVAHIRDVEDEDDDNPDGKPYVIDAKLIRRGLSKLTAMKLDELPFVYAARELRTVWHSGRDIEDLDFDAETADMVVQLGLFGKVIYG